MQKQQNDLILKIMAALGVYYLAVTACAIYAQMYYFGDAASFFLGMLKSGDFVRLNSNRIYAHYATQFLPMAAMKVFGVKKYAVLSYLYGINLYLPWMAGLAICYAISRKTNPYLMVFPLLSLFGVAMNSVFFIVSQAHVISSVFWALIFYMTLKEKFSLKDAIIFFILALVFMKSYESAVFLGPILVVVSVTRILRGKGARRLFWAAATVLFAASVIIALREILRPYDSVNETNFIKAIFGLYRHYPAVVSTGFILVSSILFFLPDLPKKYFVVLTTFLLAASVLVSFGPLLKPHLIVPGLQYDARVLMAYVIPPLGILFYLIVGGRISVSDSKWKRVATLTSILMFGQISWQMIAVAQWDGLRKIYREELSGHRGPLLFEDSILSRDSVGNQLIRPLVWPSWTIPTMCILWSEGGNVSTIIIRPEYKGWRPFDPLRIEELPKVEQFGFSYKAYRESPSQIERTYVLGRNLIFSSEGNYSRYVLNGWSFAEEGHVWTEGNTASLAFKMPDPLHDLTVDAEVLPFVVPPSLARQHVTLSVNGKKVGEQELSSPGTLHFTVPRSIWLRNDIAVLEFKLPDAAAPSSLGVNNDPRRLALAFRSLTIH